MIPNDELDFTRKNLPELVKRLREGTITDGEMHEIAANTSDIVGIPVKWMGNGSMVEEDFPELRRLLDELNEEIMSGKRSAPEWLGFHRREKPKPVQTKLGEKEVLG